MRTPLPRERRLTDIITNNGARVSNIIENVLKLSRRDSTRQERIEPNGWLYEFRTEFRETMQIDDRWLRFNPSARRHRNSRRSLAPASASVESVRERIEIWPPTG